MGRFDSWSDIALAYTRDHFAEAYPHPFLFALVGETQRNEDIDITRATRPLPREEKSRALVLPVVKLQETQPSMITVGRTRNNDVVIADSQISRFHAWFQIDGSKVADAGSRNGTRVRGHLLESKGRAMAVSPGDPVRFGGLELTLLDAGSLWDVLIHEL